jgi:fluoroacetyl-CoA thioesterase
MKDSLKSGLTFEFKFLVPENKTVPQLYPEAKELQEMPKVFATGFLVGLIEWTCIQAINPHIDWPKEQSVGVGINMSHSAATPPGLTVTVKVKLEEVDGRKLNFSFTADDGIDTICAGEHGRYVIDAAKFNSKVESKLNKAE